ncbi:hypothetical protein [Ancylobacter terrae]|uniref:hypothetical protein n=1 Tax=Ancylobacter sp. sgz301288 TaxID=3342077 RepID=UPI00385B28D3
MMKAALSLLLAVLRIPFEAAIAVIVILDEAMRPLYRPLLRAIARLKLMALFEAWVAARPRAVILVLLGAPFIIIEPMKILGLVLIGQGAFRTGALVFGLAHLASFVLVERIYRAGEAKLMSYRWFATVMGFVAKVRDAVLDRVRASAAWRWIGTARARVRAYLDRLRRRPRG